MEYTGPDFQQLLHSHLKLAGLLAASKSAASLSPLVVYGAAAPQAAERILETISSLSLLHIVLSDVEMHSDADLFRMVVGRLVQNFAVGRSPGLLASGVKLGPEDCTPPKAAMATALSIAAHAGVKRGGSANASAAASTSASQHGIGAIDSLVGVAQALRNLLQPEQAFIVVVKGAERIAAEHPSCIEGLFRLASLAGRCVVPLFLSESATTITRVLPAAATPPVCLHVPPPTEAEAMAHLATQAPPDADKALFLLCCRHVWGSFHATVGCDLSELAYIACSAFPLYEAAVAEGVSPAAGGTLLRVVGPLLAPLKARLFHRDVQLDTAAVASAIQLGSRGVQSGGAAAAAGGGAATATRGTDVELPHMSKYLLIAAFIASHNAPDTDINMLSRVKSGRRRGKKRSRNAGSNAASSVLHSGPRVFTLERLQAVFHAVVSSHAGARASADAAGVDLLGTVAALQGLGLLAWGTGKAAGGLDEGKLKCVAGRSTVVNVAARLQLQLNNYLAATDV